MNISLKNLETGETFIIELLINGIVKFGEYRMNLFDAVNYDYLPKTVLDWWVDNDEKYYSDGKYEIHVLPEYSIEVQWKRKHFFVDVLDTFVIIWNNMLLRETNTCKHIPSELWKFIEDDTDYYEGNNLILNKIK